MSEYTLLHGDCLEVMRLLPENSIDTIITDPPYGLSKGDSKGGFMGKEWDAKVPSVSFWKAMLRVTKPGATLLTFGGTRTFHRMMVNIEEAGWELKETMMWVFGTGFPKGLDIGKATSDTQWDGWRTQLKPAYEPIVVAQKPLDGTYAQNAMKWGVAGFAIDEGRIGTEVLPAQLAGQARLGTFERTEMVTPERTGRYPTNLIIDEEVAVMLDEQSGITKSAQRQGKRSAKDRLRLGEYKGQEDVVMGHSDSGGASRFFYCAKAPASERGEGNNHPTVKPLSLMRYLAKLTKTPTGGTVLDPFTGSGSTGVACMMENRHFIGIEKEKEYYDIACNRLAEFDDE